MPQIYKKKNAEVHAVDGKIRLTAHADLTVDQFYTIAKKVVEAEAKGWFGSEKAAAPAKVVPASKAKPPAPKPRGKK